MKKKKKEEKDVFTFNTQIANNRTSPQMSNLLSRSKKHQHLRVDQLELKLAW